MSDTNQNHLQLAQLLAYADPALTEEARSEMASHISCCSDCRDQFIAIQNLKVNLDNSRHSIDSISITNKCVPDDLMGDFLGNRLPLPERESFSAHLLNCDGCFERAAFYTTATLKMTDALLVMEKTPDHFKEAVLPQKGGTQQATPSPLSGLIETIRSIFRSPIPAYGFAATLLLFLVVGSPSPQRTLVPLSGGSFSLYAIPAQSGPSFGFSDAGQKTGESAANFSVTLDDKLTLRWDAITGATRYTVTIAAIANDGTATEIYAGSVADPALSIDSAPLQSGTLYRYRVTGQSGESIFVGAGQFALAE